MAEGLLDKANIILTPTGYKAGTMYNVAPIEQPYEDFVFSRASVASRVNSSGLVEMVGRTLGSNLVQNGDFSEIGPDLVQNGTFDLGSELVTSTSSTDNWINARGNSVLSVEGDTVRVTIGSGSTFGISTAITTVIGKSYQINSTGVRSNSSGQLIMRVANSANLSPAIYQDVTSDDLTLTTSASFTATATTTYVGFLATLQTTGDYIETNLLSVKEVPDWTLGTYTSIENNKAVITNSTGEISLRQSLGVAQKTIKVTYTISDYVSGVLRMQYGAINGTNRSANGTYTDYIKGANVSQDLLIYSLTSDTSLSITNVVVQELDPNDYWTFSGGNITINDEGCRINRISSTTFIQQNVLTSGKVYKVEFDVLDKPDNSGTFIVRLGSNNVYDVVTYEGTRFSKYITSAGIDFRIYSSSNNGVIYVDNIVVQEVIDTNNIPRINYDSNGENGHWLLEPTSTNLITYSENFEDSSWSNASVGTAPTLEGGYTAPDGSSNAYKISNANQNSFWYSSSVIGADNSRTIWARTVSGTGTAQLTSHNSNTNNTFNLTETWQRFEVNGTTSGIGSTNFYAVDFRGSGTLTELLIWGAQAEALSYATSYIPTLTGSTETRATETANGAGSADLINSTEGVLYAEIAALADDGTSRTISLSSGSTSNRVFIQFRSTSGQVNSGIVVSNSAQAVISHTITQTQYIKMAFKYKANDFALWVNGVEVGTDTSGTTFTANTLTELNFDSGSGAEDFYGKCKALTVFNTALTDAELTELTS